MYHCLCSGSLNLPHWLYGGTIRLAINVNIYHECNVNCILIFCVHYICHLSLCTCCEAIKPSSGLWRSVYSDVHKARFCNFMQTAIPRSSVFIQSLQAALLRSARCTVLLLSLQLEATPGRSNAWRFVFTQLSVTSVFLCRGPRGHQGGWHSLLFRWK